MYRIFQTFPQLIVNTNVMLIAEKTMISFSNRVNEDHKFHQWNEIVNFHILFKSFIIYKFHWKSSQVWNNTNLFKSLPSPCSRSHTTDTHMRARYSFSLLGGLQRRAKVFVKSLQSYKRHGASVKIDECETLSILTYLLRLSHSRLFFISIIAYILRFSLWAMSKF